MKTLNEYIKESLLDDFDDLVKNSDQSVKNSIIFGSHYVTYISKFNMRTEFIFDLNLMKKINPPILQNDFLTRTKKIGKTVVQKKPSKLDLLVVNYILGLSAKELNTDLHTGYISRSSNIIREIESKMKENDYDIECHIFRSTNINKSICYIDVEFKNRSGQKIISIKLAPKNEKY